HQTEIEGKLKLVLGSELRKEYVTKKEEEFRIRQNHWRKKRKSFSDGEEIVKPCLQIFARRLGDKSIERKADEIALSKQTVTRRTEELSHDVSQQLKDLVHSCTFFSLALDESTDIRGIDDHFSVFEELVSLESLHGKTRGSDIFDKVKSCIENLQLDSSKVAGTTTLLENFLNRPLLKYHCIIHQESLCGKPLNLQHVMLPVVKCVNKIRARALNRREFREYCEMLDLEYGDLVLHCEVRWLSRGQVLSSRFRDFAKEEDCILAFINPFLLSEQKIMELIDLKTNSLLKIKFDELSSVPNASDMINF
ncbi:General transcription factor II-I repeat domain-containing protein 2A-like 5, partial [Homarus americanus]